DRIFLPLAWLPVPFALAVALLAWVAPRLRIITVLLFSLAIIASFAASIFAATFFFSAVPLTNAVSASSATYAVTVFTVVMVAAAIAVTPAVMVVGFDVAELGTEAVAWGLGLLARMRKAATVLGILLPVAGVGVMSRIIFDFHRDRSANIG